MFPLPRIFFGIYVFSGGSTTNWKYGVHSIAAATWRRVGKKYVWLMSGWRHLIQSDYLFYFLLNHFLCIAFAHLSVLCVFQTPRLIDCADDFCIGCWRLLFSALRYGMYFIQLESLIEFEVKVTNLEELHLFYSDHLLHAIRHYLFLGMSVSYLTIISMDSDDVFTCECDKRHVRRWFSASTCQIKQWPIDQIPRIVAE